MGRLGISQAVFVAAFSLLAPAFAVAAAPTGVVMPTVNCKSMMAELDRKIANDKAYKSVRDALNADPKEKCKLNTKADHDKNYGLRGQQYRRNTHRECTAEDQSLCLATYSRIKSSFEEYRTLVNKGCEIAGKAAEACANSATEPKRFQCVAEKLREAAKAEEEAHKAIAQAGKDAEEYHKLTSELSRVYTNDRTIISRFSGEDLTTARAIRNGQLDRSAPEGGLLQQLRDRESMARPGTGSTVTGSTVISDFGGAQNLQTYYQSAEQLAAEQRDAASAAKGFRSFAAEEASYRERSQQTLLEMARENELRAVRTQTSSEGRSIAPTKVASTGNNITGGSTLGQMQQAMALTQAGAGLTNAMGAQPAAGVAQAAAPSIWENVTGAVQNIAGIGTGPGNSKLGGDDTAKGGGTHPAPGDVPGTPKDDNPGRADLSGSFGVASNGGDVFVSGLNDLPEAGAASRAPAAANAKPGEGLGADVKGSKKKKGAPEPGDAPACPPGQDCAALVAAGTAFNKGGSLGVPVVGAADPGLDVKGALDGLFGELPTLDANGNPAAAASTGGGFGFTESEMMVGTGQGASGTQSSPEVAPANSRTLFARVRGAHEKALKKGAVSLFHKKL